MSSKTRAAPASLYVLAAASVAIGVGVHILAVHKPPFQEMKKLQLGTPVQIRQHLGLAGGDWTTKSIFGAQAQLTGWGKAFDGFASFGVLIVTFFKTFLQHKLGQALLLEVLSPMVSFSSFFINEALKPQRNATLGILGAIGVLLVGQLICIGAAVPILFVPAYMARRVREYRRNPTGIQPLPAPPKAVLDFSLVLHTLGIGTALVTAFLPTSNKHWVTSNLLFQFFPLVYLPLAAWPLARGILGVGSDAHRSSKDGQVVVRANRHLVDTYALSSYLALACHIGALALAAPQLGALLRGALAVARQAPRALANGTLLPTLHAIARKDAGLRTDGEWLLLFDAAGLMLSGVLIVLADATIDEWIVSAPPAALASTAGGQAKAARTQRRVHAQRFWAEDLLIGVPSVALLGPGFALARYFQRRELLAEKARVEQVAGKVE